MQKISVGFPRHLGARPLQSQGKFLKQQKNCDKRLQLGLSVVDFNETFTESQVYVSLNKRKVLNMA